MSTTIESLELQIQSSATSATTGIDSLSSSLSKLRNSIKGDIGLNGVVNQVRNLDAAVRSIDGSSADRVDRLASSLSKLSNLGKLRISASVGNQIKNIANATASLKNTDFSRVGKLASDLKPLGDIEGAKGLRSVITQLKKLPEVATAMKSIDWITLESQIKRLASSLVPLANQLSIVGNAFSNLPTKVQRLTNVSSKIAQTNNTASTSYMNLWAKFSMGIQAIRTGARTIGACITESNKYVENLNLFVASMGEYAKEAQNFAEKVGDAMGIDPAEWMRNQGVFNTIITGFGVASDRAYTMSKNLTQLGYDLSSFFNISYQDSMQKLSSGISGELEPLRRLGYDLSVARLQQEAYNLGINKSINSMTQAEKAQLRYYAIMTQVTVAQGDMARTLNAPANQLRVFQAQAIMTARSIGNIFIPALNAILPYAIAVIKVIRLLANAIASLFHFKLPDIDYSNVRRNVGGIAKGLGDAGAGAGNLGRGLGKAAKKAKELKNNLLGIDELNIISKDDNPIADAMGGGAGGGGIGDALGGDDLGFELPQYNFLEGLVENNVNKIVDIITGALNEIAATLSLFSFVLGAILVLTGANIPVGLALMVAGAAGIVSVTATNWSKMSKRLAKTLSMILGVMGGFLLVIGAILAFGGVSVPLGIALMAAGATAIATACTINWKFLGGNISSTLALILSILGGALLALGLILVCTGVALPIGIALIAAGAAGIAGAVALNWKKMPDSIKKIISTIMDIVGGAFLAIGALLAFSGTNIPVGIALIAAGALSLISSTAMNWDSLRSSLSKVIAKIVTVVSGALIALGAILAFSGVATPLGIKLIAVGVVSLLSAAGLKWGSILKPIKKVLKEIGLAVGAAFLALGVLLVLTGVGIGVGMALILAGAASIVASIALNWGSIVDKVKKTLGKIWKKEGKTMLAIGILLSLSGVGLPLGLALIAAGAASIATAKGVDWDSIVDKVKGTLSRIWKKNGKSMLALGLILTLSGVGTPIGLALLVAGAASVVSSKSAEWGSVGKRVKSELDSIGNYFDSWKDKVSKKMDEVKKKFKGFGSKTKDRMTTGRDTSASSGNPISLPVKLVKKGWSRVEDIVGNIPTLSQFIKLAKEKWTTIKNWIGNIPILKQFISLAKSGWSRVTSWVSQFITGNVSQKISLIKGAWSSVSQWVRDRIHGAVDVTVNLVKGRVDTFTKKARKWLGLSTGGYITGSGIVHQFASGGIIGNSGVSYFANGTANAGMHGSLFVAGENGAEIVGHLNGQTEVLNKSQISMAMRSAVISGMAQFTGYWRNMTSQMTVCTNAIINSILVSSETLSAAAMATDSYGADSALAQSVYEDSQRAYSRSYSDDNISRSMQDFYKEYVEPTLKEIASDTKKQADKQEQTIVQIGNRTITDTIVKQQKANGFVFNK